MRRPQFLAQIVVACVFSIPVASQTITTGSGIVEIIGLRQWTIPMLVDSIRRYRPDVTLGDAACAEILRDSLGFPDAAVFRFRDGRVVLTVIEPADSHRVALRPIPSGPSGPDGPWTRLRALHDSGGFAVDYAVGTFLRRKSGVEIEPTADSAIVRDVWRILEADARDGERQTATAALLDNPDARLRRAAAYYMVRYPESDSTWYALARALRDPDWGVRGNANAVLRSFRTAAPRALDWQPAAVDLRHLLDGTTLVYQLEVVKLLLATQIAPGLSSTLLSPDGIRLLLAQKDARHEYVKEPAAEFLRRMSGIDHAAEPARWETWVRTRLGGSR